MYVLGLLTLKDTGCSHDNYRILQNLCNNQSEIVNTAFPVAKFTGLDFDLLVLTAYRPIIPNKFLYKREALNGCADVMFFYHFSQ